MRISSALLLLALSPTAPIHAFLPPSATFLPPSPTVKGSLTPSSKITTSSRPLFAEDDKRGAQAAEDGSAGVRQLLGVKGGEKTDDIWAIR